MKAKRQTGLGTRFPGEYGMKRLTGRQARGRSGQIVTWAAVLLLLGTFASAEETTQTGKDVADRVAAYLERGQIKSGFKTGMWPFEPYFAGPSTVGLARAYQWMGNPAYRQAATLGGNYLLWIGESTGHLLGDEAYALTVLSSLSEDPAVNLWRAALIAFYNRLRTTYGMTTDEYIDLLTQGDPSNDVFYVAHHTVAAYYIDDADKEIWRARLIRCLASVDDRSNSPIQALGIATWALAQTGPLDGTPVDCADDNSYWSGVALKDLPGLLLNNQIPEGEPFAGSFYWLFDHTDTEIDSLAGGWTEDAIFGTLGLVAAASVEKGELADELEQGIKAAYTILLEASDAEGKVVEHLSGFGEGYYTYAGELLQTLWAAQQYLDATKAAATQDGVEPASQIEP